MRHVLASLMSTRMKITSLVDQPPVLALHRRDGKHVLKSIQHIPCSRRMCRHHTVRLAQSVPFRIRGKSSSRYPWSPTSTHLHLGRRTRRHRKFLFPRNSQIRGSTCRRATHDLCRLHEPVDAVRHPAGIRIAHVVHKVPHHVVGVIRCRVYMELVSGPLFFFLIK